MFTGDRVPLTKSSEPATAFVLRLSAGPAARDIFIRLASTSTRLAHFEVLTATELRRDTSRLDHLGAIYLTIIGVFLLWGVVQLFSRPNVLLVTFVVFQACTYLATGALRLLEVRHHPVNNPPGGKRRDLFLHEMGRQAKPQIGVVTLL
jgi:hypothetical protein